MIEIRWRQIRRGLFEDERHTIVFNDIGYVFPVKLQYRVLVNVMEVGIQSPIYSEWLDAPLSMLSDNNEANNES